MRATIKLKRPITDLELDVDENSIIPKWIPCSERLPETGVDVLVTAKDREGTIFVFSAYLSEDKDYWVGDETNWYTNSSFGVIAWQPLPEPYREESNETD